MSLKHQYQFVPVLDTKSLFIPGADDKEGLTIEGEIMNGYDGVGGVHDNMVWIIPQGKVVYTLNNKIIIEITKSR